jgi:enamine deaminase RidA (YjgF/YER057c/UK114 family)
MPRKNISSGAQWESIVGYSRAVRIGNTIEVAGTTAVKDRKIQHENDPYGQTVVILEIIKNALEEAGASITDVVRTRIFVTDISHWKEVGRAHGEVFGDIRPATTMVEVSGLVDPSMLVEIEATAILHP